jgi:hypothetical protein
MTYGEVMAAVLGAGRGPPLSDSSGDRPSASQCPDGAFEHCWLMPPDPTGIYGDHLRYCLATVRQQPELVEAIRALTQAEDGLKLSSAVAYQLDNLGVIQLKGYRSYLSCRLYQQFFAAEFAEADAADLMLPNPRMPSHLPERSVG